MEPWLEPRLLAPRPRKIDLDYAFDAARVSAEDEDAVRKEHRLVKGVGHVHDCPPLATGPMLPPNRSELLLKYQPCLCIDRGMRLVPEEDSRVRR